MGALTGRFSGTTSTGFSDVSVVIVNEDLGELGNILVEVYRSAELEDLVEPVIMGSTDEAIQLVDQDQSAAMIHIPENFSQGVMSTKDPTHSLSDVQITFYRNPTQPTSAGIIRSILDQFIEGVNVARTQTNITIQQLITNGLISPDQAAVVAEQIGETSALSDKDSQGIEIINQTAEGNGIKFDILAYMAPGMAIMFLMFTVTYGGRSLLVENRNGTLARLNGRTDTWVKYSGWQGIRDISHCDCTTNDSNRWNNGIIPTAMGRCPGCYLADHISCFWCNRMGNFVCIRAETPGQVSITGSATMLLFGIIGGSFFDLSMLPGWVSIINKITPNAWAIDGFYILSVGGRLQDITQHIIALFLMGIILLVISTLIIERRGLVRK